MAVFLATISYAQTPQPPWLQAEVVRAALAMELSESQQPQFTAALSAFIDNQTAATNKILRRNNQADLERKIKSSTNRQLKKMDVQMVALLNEEQQVHYQTYRRLLREQLVDSALGRGQSSSATKNNAHSALHSNPNAH